MKDTLQSIGNREDHTEDRISELEVKSLEIIQFEEQKRNMKENEQSLRNPWDIIKYTNILIRGIPEGEEVGQDQKNIFLRNG